MIPPHEEAIVKKWNSEIRHAIRMGLSLTEDEQSNLFREYCDHLMRITPQIRIENDAEEDDVAPTIRIGKNIRYQALPRGNELEPFLRVLSDSPASVNRIAVSLQDQLDKILPFHGGGVETEQVGVARAVGGAEPRDRPIGERRKSGREVAFQVIGRADRNGELKISRLA